MRFAGWLAKFTDIVNLGKLVVDGGPGALLAIALVSMISYSTEVPVIPLGDKFDERLEEAETALSYHRGLVADAEEALKELSIQQAELGQRLATLRTEREALRTERASLELSGLDRSTVRYNRLRARERQLTEAIEGDVADANDRGLLEDIATVEGDIAQQTEGLATLRAELAPLLERHESLRALEIENGTDILNLLLDHLIGIAIVGYVLGTLTSPLYRAIFVNGFDHAILVFPRLANFVGGAGKSPNANDLERVQRQLAQIKRRLEALR